MTERMTSAKNMAWVAGRQLDTVLWQYWLTMLAPVTNMLTYQSSKIMLKNDK